MALLLPSPLQSCATPAPPLRRMQRRFIFTEFKPLNTYNFSAYARNIAGWSNASASVAIEAPNVSTAPCARVLRTARWTEWRA